MDDISKIFESDIRDKKRTGSVLPSVQKKDFSASRGITTLQRVNTEVCEELQIQIVALECDKDHTHMFLNAALFQTPGLEHYRNQYIHITIHTVPHKQAHPRHVRSGTRFSMRRIMRNELHKVAVLETDLLAKETELKTLNHQYKCHINRLELEEAAKLKHESQ